MLHPGIEDRAFPSDEIYPSGVETKLTRVEIVKEHCGERVF